MSRCVAWRQPGSGAGHCQLHHAQPGQRIGINGGAPSFTPKPTLTPPPTATSARPSPTLPPATLLAATQTPAPRPATPACGAAALMPLAVIAWAMKKPKKAL